MNVFRLAGDLSHLLAICILLLKIFQTESCAGVSGKTQVLFLITYVSRYMDLYVFLSAYNTVMKIFFIFSTAITVYVIYRSYRSTYDQRHDTVRIEALVLPCAVLAFIYNYDYTPLEIMWTFSIYLEAVAILPQLFMIFNTGEAETITSHYLFALGSYRALYILNWIYRYYYEGWVDEIALFAGIVQTALYCDFFYLYVTKVLKGDKLLTGLAEREGRLADRLPPPYTDTPPVRDASLPALSEEGAPADVDPVQKTGAATLDAGVPTAEKSLPPPLSETV